MCLPKPAGVLNVLERWIKFLIDFARAVEDQLLYVSELESKFFFTAFGKVTGAIDAMIERSKLALIFLRR